MWDKKPRPLLGEEWGEKKKAKISEAKPKSAAKSVVTVSDDESVATPKPSK
jgi:hypothetical protein